jgi:hypothetical protein
MPWLLYSQYPLYRRWGGSQKAILDIVAKRKIPAAADAGN